MDEILDYVMFRLRASNILFYFLINNIIRIS